MESIHWEMKIRILPPKMKFIIEKGGKKEMSFLKNIKGIKSYKFLVILLLGKGVEPIKEA